MSDRIVKNSEVCDALGISDYKRKQLIKKGILDAPVDLGFANPVHTQEQIYRAKKRIAQAAESFIFDASIKPISAKLLANLKR